MAKIKENKVIINKGKNKKTFKRSNPEFVEHVKESKKIIDVVNDEIIHAELTDNYLKDDEKYKQQILAEHKRYLDEFISFATDIETNGFYIIPELIIECGKNIKSIMSLFVNIIKISICIITGILFSIRKLFR